MRDATRSPEPPVRVHDGDYQDAEALLLAAFRPVEVQHWTYHAPADGEPFWRCQETRERRTASGVA